MKRGARLFIFATAAVAFLLLVAPPGQAAMRTWVASTGNDANPCTRAMPCASFQIAYVATDAFGEINCVDAGSFGFLDISKSITVSCEAGTAGIIPSSTFGVVITAAASDIVYLKGLDIEGLGGTNTAASGITFNSGGTLHVEKCRIHGFSGVGYGILFRPSNTAALFVSDSVLADNGSATSGGNINVAPGIGASLINVALKNVRMEGGEAGFQITDNASTTVHAIVEDSLAAGSAGDGFLASTTGGRVTMLIDHSTAANNTQNGIEAIGANVEIDVGYSRLYGNGGSTAISGGGPALLSFGNNEIVGNGRNAALTTTSTQ